MCYCSEQERWNVQRHRTLLVYVIEHKWGRSKIECAGAQKKWDELTAYAPNALKREGEQ